MCAMFYMIGFLVYARTARRPPKRGLVSGEDAVSYFLRMLPNLFITLFMCCCAMLCKEVR